MLAPGDPTPPKVRTVSLNVQQFMADEAGRVELDADWTLQQQNRPARTRHEMIQVNAGGTGGEAIAAAMSQAVGQLADRISAAL